MGTVEALVCTLSDTNDVTVLEKQWAALSCTLSDPIDVIVTH